MKSMVGFILGLIGSIINLFLGLFVGVLFFLVFFSKKGLDDLGMSAEIISFANTLSIWLLVLAIVFLIGGILGLIFSVKMNRQDNFEVKKGGWGCLILGVISLSIFLFIAGVFGIVYSKKDGVGGTVPTQTPAQQYVQKIQQRKPTPVVARKLQKV